MNLIWHVGQDVVVTSPDGKRTAGRVALILDFGTFKAITVRRADGIPLCVAYEDGRGGLPGFRVEPVVVPAILGHSSTSG